jgi:nucleoside-diphosphate-sugar epimerase
MLVAITGGTGFVGSRLAALHLERGDRVRILRRPGSPSGCLPGAQVNEGDVTIDDDRLSRFVEGAEILYHCAAEVRDRNRLEATNIHGTRILVRRAAGRIGRCVFASSVAVYGHPGSDTITEDHPLRPATLYGRTKAEAESLMRAAAAEGGFKLSIVRPSSIIGAGMPSTALFRLLEALQRGWFFFIGRPGAVMNYVPVANVAAGLLLCGTDPAAAGKAFNLSDSLPIERFVAILADELRIPAPALRLPEPPLRAVATVAGWLPGMPLNLDRLNALTARATYSSDRLRRELAYRPALSLEQGLRDLARNWMSTR